MFAIATSSGRQILMFSKMSFQKNKVKKKRKKRLVLIAVEVLLHFIFWKKNLRTFFVLFGKGIETKFLNSFSCLINIIQCFFPVCYKCKSKVSMLLNKYD